MELSSDPSHSLSESTASQSTAAYGPKHWREVTLTRLVPVTQQMACSHIGQEPGLRSY